MTSNRVVAVTETALMRRWPDGGSGVEGVAQIQPQGAVINEAAPDFRRHSDKGGDVFGVRRFDANLPVEAVVTLPPVGRRRDYGAD